MTILDRVGTAARILLILLIASFTITCGGDSGSGPGDDGTDGPTTLSISLSVSSAMPPDEVDIDGIPASMDISALYAEITSGAGTQYASLIGRRDDNSVYMVTPLNADDPGGAGDVDVRVTDGANVTSNTVSLHIEELPPASTTFADIVAKMQALLDSHLASHGRTREELRAMSSSEMGATDIVLAIAHEMLDSPDNPNSMRATVDGPVPFFESATLDFTLADRLLSRTGLGEFLTEESASVDSLLAEPDPDTLLTSSVAGPFTRHDEQRVRARGAACIDMGTAGISTALGLHRAMELGRFSQRRLDGASGKVVNDAAAAFSALAMIPEPDAKAIAKAMGGVIYVYKLVNEASSKLLPTDFDNSATTYTRNPAEFNEDGLFGFWNQFKVTAVSDGWEMDEDVLNALLRFAKFSDNGGIRNLFGDANDDFQKNLTSYLVTLVVKKIISEVTEGQDFIEVCPGVWPNIDCTFPNYSKPTLISGTSIEFINGEHNGYKPKEVGVSQLRVETHPSRFGGALAFRIQPVEVKQIQVLVTPTSVRAEAEEILTFDAEVKNADNTAFQWIIPAGFTLIDQVGNSVVIQCPNQPWNPSALLKARSQANTGLRQGKVESDPRDGVATISYGDFVVVEITPSYKCLSNTEKFTFEADVIGVEEYTVVWKLEEGYGQINENTGEYTAPPVGITDDVISAQVVGFPDAKDYAKVHVGACTCAYNISIIGAGNLSAQGGDIAYLFTDLPEGFHTYTFFVMLDDPSIPEDVGIGMSLGPTEEGGQAPRPGQTGFYDLQMSFFTGSNSWTSGGDGGDMTIEILEHTDVYMVANISGTLVQGEGVDRTTCFVNGTFRAGRWGDEGWPCE